MGKRRKPAAGAPASRKSKRQKPNPAPVQDRGAVDGNKQKTAVKTMNNKGGNQVSTERNMSANEVGDYITQQPRSFVLELLNHLRVCSHARTFSATANLK